MKKTPEEILKSYESQEMDFHWFVKEMLLIAPEVHSIDTEYWLRVLDYGTNHVTESIE